MTTESVRSYLAAMLFFHDDTFKARAMFAPRSRAVKKPCRVSLNKDIQQIILGIKNKFHCMSAQSEPIRRLTKEYTHPPTPHSPCDRLGLKIGCFYTFLQNNLSTIVVYIHESLAMENKKKECFALTNKRSWQVSALP